MKKTILFLLLIPLLIGCAPSPAASIGTGCDSLQPTQGDIQYSLNFGDSLFTDAVWSRSYTVREQEAIVSWTHRSVAALSDVSLQLFCDDNGTADLELYYNNDTVKQKFSNYDSVNIINSCKNTNTVLYEVDAVEQGVNYTIHQWFQAINKTRLLAVVIVFPKEESVLVQRYSQGLFPTLSACE